MSCCRLVWFSAAYWTYVSLYENCSLKSSHRLWYYFTKAKPAYLHDDLHDYGTNLLECSGLNSTAHLLQRPRIVTSVASRSFTVAAPTARNSLSVNTRSADSFASFKRRLKSELFACRCYRRSATTVLPRDSLHFINRIVAAVVVVYHEGVKPSYLAWILKSKTSLSK